MGLLADKLKPGLREGSPDACQEYIDFYAYQHAMFLPFGLLAMGGILFLVACRWVVADKQAVER